MAYRIIISVTRLTILIERRQQFAHQRKQHYNEFDVVRLHRKEIEAELRALEQDDQQSIVVECQHDNNSK
jgi:hypothetical protein